MSLPGLSKVTSIVGTLRRPSVPDKETLHRQTTFDRNPCSFIDNCIQNKDHLRDLKRLSEQLRTHA